MPDQIIAFLFVVVVLSIVFLIAVGWACWDKMFKNGDEEHKWNGGEVIDEEEWGQWS